MSGDPTLWILARSTGVLGYGLLSATVIAGLTAKSRPIRKLNPAATVDMHRFLSLLALMAVALHGVFLVLDTSVQIPILALFVPGTSPYRPLWVALGVLGAEMMLLIHLSFRFRKRIGVRNWRRMHYATYLAYAGATTHGLMAGTDSSRPWALAMYVVTTGAVVGLTAWRILTPGRAPRPAAPPRPAVPAPVAAEPAMPVPVAPASPVAEPEPVMAARVAARPAVRFRASPVVPSPGHLRHRPGTHPSRAPAARSGAPRGAPAGSES